MSLSKMPSQVGAKSYLSTLVALATTFGALSTESAQAQSASFAGKTITLMCHTTPGGGYDAYVRLLSRYLGRFLPGSPNVIVVNKPGAGGYVAANYAANIAPRDGTFMVLMQQSTLIDEPMGQSTMRTSLREFNWIGNLSQSNNLVVTWHTSPIKTIGDAQKRESTIGASGANSTAAQIPAFINAILGTRFKVVRGYEGGVAINLAMERGEVDGRGSGTWATYKSTSTADLRDGKLNLLVQIGLRKETELPNVPLLADLVKGDATKEQVAHFVSLGLSISRPLAAPPGVPPERVELLRRAFDATMKDLQFLDEADRLSLEIDPMTGEEVQTGVSQVLATPPNVIDVIRSAMAAPNN
jgi:tripartite-type tricarboxylate transporter receptor subunit TctC